MTNEEKKEFGELIERAIEGSLSTNDDELYEDAQRDIQRISELFDSIETEG